MLIEDLAEEDFSALLSDKILVKVSASLDNFSSEIDNAKEFLEATSQKQASIVLDAQKTAEKHAEITNKLSEASDKISALDLNP